MLRIDVISIDEKTKKKFKVMVNFMQRGIDYRNANLANQEAQKIHDTEIPTATINFVK